MAFQHAERRDGTPRMNNQSQRPAMGTRSHFADIILALSIAAFSCLYYLAVRTHAGQRLDASAVRAPEVLRVSQFRLAVRMHDWVSVVSIAFLGGAIVVVAFVRRRPRQAIASGIIMTGSTITSEVIKHTWSRPFLRVNDSLGHHNTFPSGHTTVAMALGVGAIVVASAASRRRVAPLAAVFASVVGASLVATASHRPSDIMGAAVVVLGWAAAVSLVMQRAGLRRRPEADDEPSGAWLTISGLLLMLLGFAAAGIIIIAAHIQRLPTIPIGRTFLASASAITGTVFICIAGVVRLQRD